MIVISVKLTNFFGIGDRLPAEIWVTEELNLELKFDYSYGRRISGLVATCDTCHKKNGEYLKENFRTMSSFYFDHGRLIIYIYV